MTAKFTCDKSAITDLKKACSTRDRMEHAAF